MQPAHHVFRRVALVAAGYPVLWLALFYSFALRARMVLGHWPRYNHPDPKSLEFTLHHGAVTLGMLALPLATLVGLALGVVIHARTRRMPIGLLVALVAAPLLVLAILRCEPLGLAEWFID